MIGRTQRKRPWRPQSQTRPRQIPNPKLQIPNRIPNTSYQMYHRGWRQRLLDGIATAFKMHSSSRAAETARDPAKRSWSHKFRLRYAISLGEVPRLRSGMTAALIMRARIGYWAL